MNMNGVNPENSAMNVHEIRRKAKEFRKESGIKEISSGSLVKAIERYGFTVIEYNPVVNDHDVETLIRYLNLAQMIAKSNGFLVADQNYRLIFINEKLSDAEKKFVLEHEIGHYCCGHTSYATVIGRNVSEEYEASEFAHYLLQETLTERCSYLWNRYRKWLIMILMTVLVTTAAGVGWREYRERELYENEYYVTATGMKYHLKNCVTIEGHKVRRLTKKDVESGLYEPCGVCLAGE